MLRGGWGEKWCVCVCVCVCGCVVVAFNGIYLLDGCLEIWFIFYTDLVFLVFIGINSSCNLVAFFTPNLNEEIHTYNSFQLSTDTVKIY